MGAAELRRLARLLGRRDFYAAAGIGEGAVEPDSDGRARIAALVNARLAELTAALVAEAAASDDVADVGSARRYAEASLGELGDLLSAEQRAAVLHGFAEVTASWEARPP